MALKNFTHDDDLENVVIIAYLHRYLSLRGGGLYYTIFPIKRHTDGIILPCKRRSENESKCSEQFCAQTSKIYQMSIIIKRSISITTSVADQLIYKYRHQCGRSTDLLVSPQELDIISQLYLLFELNKSDREYIIYNERFSDLTCE